MKSLFVFTGFFFLAVLARKDPGEYWQHVMKDEPMPEFIQALVGTSKVTCTDNKNNGHFHITSQKTSLDPVPSVTAYTDDVKPENHKHFTKQFEPSPSVTAYSDDVKPEGEKKMLAEEFEPSPNVSVYSDGVKPEEDRVFTKEFEPSPNVSAYNDGIIELKAEN